jgi:uncharacterized protein YegJ (DUF2314 family)
VSVLLMMLNCNTPQAGFLAVRSVREGDEQRVAFAEVGDWCYTRNDKLVGGFTNAILLKLPTYDLASYNSLRM